MGRGAGVSFDTTLGDFTALALKAKGPDWIKKSDLGVKIGKKKEFTDHVVVPIQSVTMEAAYSSATVKSYDNQPPIGYLRISAEEINEAISEEIQNFKERYYPGSKLTELTLEVHGPSSQPRVYSAGWVRSAFPTDGQMDAGDVDLTLYFEVTNKDGKKIRGENISLDGVSGTLYFPDHDGFIPFERWMPQEYDRITVQEAYEGIDDLWNEDEPEDE